MISFKSIFVISVGLIFSGYCCKCAPFSVDQDTLKERQILYNGRIWRNLHANVRGTQFLFSPDFLQGTIRMNGRVFVNVPLKYDAFEDQLITQTTHGSLLKFNKEMADSFSLKYDEKDYSFVRSDSTQGFSGYVNVLYNGKSTFIVKYQKKIDLLAVDNMYDEFYLVRKLFLVKDNSAYQFFGRREFFKLLGNHKKEVRNFRRSNGIKPSKNVPESFIPLISYFDSIR
ncbi:MAG TPA: hypothetical protein VHO46_14865 [Bacteroidales bacterium]|nr:hypothetical protein [Bacteroidales bacterium]